MNLFYWDSALSVIGYSVIQLNCQSTILNRLVDFVFYINDTNMNKNDIKSHLYILWKFSQGGFLPHSVLFVLLIHENLSPLLSGWQEIFDDDVDEVT